MSRPPRPHDSTPSLPLARSGGWHSSRPPGGIRPRSLENRGKTALPTASQAGTVRRSEDFGTGIARILPAELAGWIQNDSTPRKGEPRFFAAGLG